MSTSATRRQRRFPSEFRIEPFPVPPDQDDGMKPRGTDDEGGKPVADDAVKSFATEMWRAHRWVGEDKAERDPERSARLGRRHLERAVEGLGDTGVTVHDYDGQSYDPGMQVQVLAFQESPHLTTPTILETVMPAVIRDNRLIQEAEVIVGVPSDDDSHQKGTSDE